MANALAASISAWMMAAGRAGASMTARAEDMCLPLITFVLGCYPYP